MQPLSGIFLRAKIVKRIPNQAVFPESALGAADGLIAAMPAPNYRRSLPSFRFQAAPKRGHLLPELLPVGALSGGQLPAGLLIADSDEVVMC